MNSSIELINHASVKLMLGEKTILTDPWYEGSVFHKGWQLIHRQEKNQIINSIKNINYIYISHEHPDHFSPSFFLDKEVKSILTNKIVPDCNLKVVTHKGKTQYKVLLNDKSCGDDII